jgi:uncharacterized membrane protein
LHPFDIRTVVFAKHAQHVVLIHFPIALFIAGVAFDFLARWKKQSLFAAAASCNLFAAALTTLPVVATGLLAWQWALEGERLKGILLMHLVMGCVSTVLIWVVWLIHRRTQQRQRSVSARHLLLIEALAVAVLAVTGHLGGFLSGVNGLG